METSVTLLGVTFLGGFVGFLLAMAIDFSKTVSLKVVTALIGAALSGGPLLFMTGLGFEKWMYPIGLVLGFLWIRVLRARSEIPGSPKFHSTLDTIAVLFLTGFVLFCSAFFTVHNWAKIRQNIFSHFEEQ